MARPSTSGDSTKPDLLKGDERGEDLLGLGGNDILLGFGGDDKLEGDSGNDVLLGGAGRDKLYGGANNDVLSDWAGWNELKGGDGDDVLVGTGGLFGGPGNDILIATGRAQVWGGLGEDILIGPGYGNVMYVNSPKEVTVNLANGKGLGPVGSEASGDRIAGFTGIVGSHHNDELVGDESDNFFRGMGGADKFFGERGEDKGADTVSFWRDNGGEGATVNLSVFGEKGKGGYAEGDTFVNIENLFGSKHDDIFTGNGRTNWLSGQDGKDKLYGLGNWDSLGGGKGDDLLNGGSGADHLTGDEGADTFVFGQESVVKTKEALLGETDKVWDFSGLRSDGVKQEDEHGDKLDLSGLKTADDITITRIELIPGKKTKEFSPDTQSGTVEGKMWYWHHVQDNPPEGQHGKWTKVAADLTGDGDANFQVDLYEHHDLTVADFVGVVAEVA